MEFRSELELLVKAKTNVIEIVTYEWQRLHGFLVGVANDFNHNLYMWSVIEGIKIWNDNEKKFENVEEDKDPMDVLNWFKQQKNLILLLEDFHPFLKEEHFEIIRQIRELCRINNNNQFLIIQTPYIVRIKDLQKEVPILELSLPKNETLKVLLESLTENLEFDKRPKSDDIDDIVSASKGLSIMEAEITYKKIIALKNRLTKYEIPLIVKEKEQIIKKSGVLEYYHPEGNFKEIGGLDNLKQWLKKRGKAFSKDAKDFGLTSPKGVLLLGVPGCGKSLVSKTIANEWNLPLLKFDLASVFGSLVGESEANMKEALSLADTISPSILWIDEIEKGLSGVGSSSDGGVSSKIFGMLLNWMQEKNSEVFVIATANDISSIPPELLRKGRFDEIFFVDLPNATERKEIFEIHINKIKRDIKKFDIDKLVENSKGFSGAEIEEAIKEAMFIAYDLGRDLETKDILKALKETYPLSKVMAQTINNLRKWAKVRARFASSENLEELKVEENVPLLAQEKQNPFIR